MKKIFQNKKFIVGLFVIFVLAMAIIIGIVITTKDDSEKTNNPDSNKPSGLTIEEGLDADSDNETQEDTLEVPSDWGDDEDSNVSAEREDEPKQEESKQEESKQDQSEEEPKEPTQQELDTDVDTSSGYGELF